MNWDMVVPTVLYALVIAVGLITFTPDMTSTTTRRLRTRS